MRDFSGHANAVYEYIIYLPDGNTPVDASSNAVIQISLNIWL